MILQYRVTEEEGGTALLHILRRSMGLSSMAVRRLKAHGGLEVDGELRFTTYLVSPGEVVTALISLAEKEGDAQPESGPLEILFEDEGLIAVNKPAGYIVHPSRSRTEGTLANFVAGYLQQSGRRPICHIVNRLDRDTSGVTLFAKNAHMKALAVKAAATGEKRYTAVAWGALTPADGVIDLPIRRFQERDMRRIVAADGKRAVTRYRTVSHGEAMGQTYSVLELILETGRTHQIRVHCLAQNAPLVGDPMYCTEESRAWSGRLGIERQLLHSHRLSLAHPLTGEALEIDAPIRDGVFRRLLETGGLTNPTPESIL